MIHLGQTLGRWLWKGRGNSSTCPACETSLPPERAFCPHCYMVLRPEGMAELHQALQGAKVREDIYILRKLHDGNEDVVISLAEASEPELERQPTSPPAESIPQHPPSEESGFSTHTPEPQNRKQKTQSLTTYAFSVPPSAGPENLPSLIQWFLNHDRLIPNNLEILEEAHRTLYGREDRSTYERHLARAIADDLHTYNSSDLLQEHLILLTTVYARTLQELLSLGPDQQDLGSPTDLPEPERHRMWELCLRFGLTATRLRVEGWIYQMNYGEPPSVKKPTIKHR
ncbi:MAG: hypothetical protein ACE5JQ_07120 [Candidatus Methylomirabilales bacterium]